MKVAKHHAGKAGMNLQHSERCSNYRTHSREQELEAENARLKKLLHRSHNAFKESCEDCRSCPYEPHDPRSRRPRDCEWGALVVDIRKAIRS